MTSIPIYGQRVILNEYVDVWKVAVDPHELFHDVLDRPAPIPMAGQHLRPDAEIAPVWASAPGDGCHLWIRRDRVPVIANIEMTAPYLRHVRHLVEFRRLELWTERILDYSI